MLKKRVFLMLVFLFLITFSISAFAEKINNNTSTYVIGTLKWNDNFNVLAKNNIKFFNTAFDREKKLFQYKITGEQINLHGVEVANTTYFFWDNSLSAINILFDSDKVNDAFQKIYDGLISKYGLPEKVFDERNDRPTAIFWQKEDTGIRLMYDQLSKNGEVYIYSIPLAKAYTEFYTALPKETTSYKNEPQGFFDMQWGQSKENLATLGKSFILNADIHEGEYFIKDDKKDFLGVPIEKTTYNFWQNQFTSAFVYYQNNETTFDKIFSAMKDRFGEPVNGRYSDSLKEYTYHWTGTDTVIILSKSVDKKLNYVYFTSKTLYNLANNQAKGDVR